MFQATSSQIVVHKPAASALPGNLLEIQIFGHHPRSTESGGRLQIIWCMLNCCTMLYTLTHLMLTTTLWDRYDYVHFMTEGIEVSDEFENEPRISKSREKGDYWFVAYFEKHLFLHIHFSLLPHPPRYVCFEKLHQYDMLALSLVLWVELSSAEASRFPCLCGKSQSLFILKTTELMAPVKKPSPPSWIHWE